MANNRELIDRYLDQDVERLPNGGADARLLSSGVSVWAIVALLSIYDDDRQKVAHHFDLSQEEVDAAVAYYGTNKALIDARIALNNA